MNEIMHSNSDGTVGYLGKITFLSNLIISILLILHYQLPFLQSGQFPDKKLLDRGASGLCDPVFLKFETHLKI